MDEKNIQFYQKNLLMSRIFLYNNNRSKKLDLTRLECPVIVIAANLALE